MWLFVHCFFFIRIFFFFFCICVSIFYLVCLFYPLFSFKSPCPSVYSIEVHGSNTFFYMTHSKRHTKKNFQRDTGRKYTHTFFMCTITANLLTCTWNEHKEKAKKNKPMTERTNDGKKTHPTAHSVNLIFMRTKPILPVWTNASIFTCMQCIKKEQKRKKKNNSNRGKSAGWGRHSLTVIHIDD